MSWTDQCPAQAPGIDLKLGFSACQSHMTAMMAMPPVVPVNHRPLRAVTHVIAMIDAEDAFHAADDAADCCANHRGGWHSSRRRHRRRGRRPRRRSSLLRE